jgi:peptidase S41-like protein
MDGDGLADDFLRDTAEPVRDHLAAAQDLPTFLRSAGSLTLDERKRLVAQALVLFEQNYAHLPLKVAMHAVNPVQRLRLLRTRLERQTPETMDSETAFHTELSATFHSVRDLHTNYLLPTPYNSKIAFLPFQIEECFENGASVYLVSRLMQGFTAPGFKQAEVKYWNGVPIGRAVDVNAARFAGSNAAARHSRGVESLTLRSLRIHLPPDEEWVVVGYVGADGTARELKQKWLIAENLPQFVAAADANAISPRAASLGIDLLSEDANRARTLLFVPGVVAQVQADGPPELSTEAAAAGADVPTTMPGVFRARSVVTESGTFGHVRIFTFNVEDEAAFVNEFIRLVGLLPRIGLILDVRGNGGGSIFASEFTLQTLTPRRIAPEPVQFIGTPLNLRICAKHKDNPLGVDLGPWFKSLDEAPETGATFSNAFPITPEDGANAVGQVYQGPVVLVTDARCYSATDIFAAGFQDHEIGPVLGVDVNTGAGGANVWTQDLLKQLLEQPTPDPDSPYKTLPKGAGMRVSIRRTLRVGAFAGTPVEDLGVVPDERHQITRNDLLNANADLMDHAGKLLAGLTVRRLEVAAALNGSDLRLDLDVKNVDRADIYVDGRPRASVDTPAGASSVTIEDVARATVVRVEGFADSTLVAARTVDI